MEENKAKKESNSLLVIVDYQNDFVDQKGKVAERIEVDLSANRNILEALKALLNRWHQNHLPVLFINSDYDTKHYEGEYKKYREEKSAFGNTAIPGTWGHALYGLTKGQGDKEIVKHFVDGFWKTDLENLLKSINPQEIYFCGVYSDVCVFHTSLHSALLGYKTFVVENCSASPDKENEKIFMNYLNKYCNINIVSSDDIKI